MSRAALRRRLLPLALALVCGLSLAAQAAPADEARRLYAAFVAGQNRHDFAAVRATLLASPEFLWVSNGLSVWGPDAALDRMMQFHGAGLWRIRPVEARARVVELGPDAAMLHIPLELQIGDPAAPEHFRFLVSALCVARAEGWRIAALLTTTANPEQWME
jgi:hypothetical protein